MYTRRMNGWGKHLDFLILDAVMLELALFLSYGIRHRWSYRGFNNIYQTLALFLALASICAGILCGNYHGILRRDMFREFRQAFIHVTVVEVVLIAAAFFVKEFSYSREVFLLLWVTGTLLCWAERCLWRKILKGIGIGKRKRRQVLLITISGQAEAVVEKWKRNDFIDCELCGVCLADGGKEESWAAETWGSGEGAGSGCSRRDGEKSRIGMGMEPGGLPTAGEGSGSDCSRTTDVWPETGVKMNPKGIPLAGVSVVGDISTIQEYLLKHVVDEVLIQPGTILNREQMGGLLQAGLTVHLGLEDLIRLPVPAYVEDFAGTTVVTSAMRIVRPWEMWVKRLIDILGSMAGLAVTGIACLFVIPAIKLADPGPAFFSQIRVGRNGRRFRMYKFRSMYTDAEERKKELMAQNEMKGAMFKMKNDPRIIKGIGQFIRRTSIDELPQFWNVLKGDMSLVGTRPPTEEEYNSYEMRYLRRLSIRPGITGIWQTSGRNAVNDFEDVVRMDTEYIMRWSLLLDIRLLFKTVKVVLAGDGAV